MSTAPRPPFDELAPEVAGRLATTSVPRVDARDTAADARASLVGQRYESAAHLVVCEEERVAGLVSIEAVLAATAATPVSDLMDSDPPSVTPGVDQEVAAWKAVDRGESSLLVLNVHDGFVGLVPPARLLKVLLREHDEDMARLGGYLRQTQEARSASSEAVTRRYWHRLPWLLVGLAAAMLAAVIVSSYEAQLTANVSLAFFLPGVIYIADAVGTQTETVVIRGLSVGVTIRDVIKQEVATGLLIGASLAAVFLVGALLWWDQTDVIVAVTLAMFAASSVATVVAMAMPSLFARFDVDPAFGSGPLATVAQDLLSIVVYFVIASAIVG